MDTGIDGFSLHPDALDRADQTALLADVLAAVAAGGGFFQPVMPRTGQPFSIRMANLGPLGWVADRTGYRYQPHHPDTGAAWGPIPDRLLALWDRLAGYPKAPECCLVNWYQGDKAKMGLHQDTDEADRAAPVLSVSLGDGCRFRMRTGPGRKGETKSFKLASGTVAVMGGAARDHFHGVDRIYPGTSTLLDQAGLPGGGRLNLTLRRVTV